jgi:hypothetical protein
MAAQFVLTRGLLLLIAAARAQFGDKELATHLLSVVVRKSKVPVDTQLAEDFAALRTVFGMTV